MDNEQANSEKIDIPEIVYQGDDKKLKERIHKFKAGSFRIAVFTVIGLFMGFFSHTYTQDSFLPTKVIFAIPYKISEAIYTSVLGTDASYTNLAYGEDLHYAFWTEFFPHSGLATFLAEGVTTLLIGGAIYGSLAYFTGDKRVFTLQRFLKFAGCWCGVILLVIGLAYGINAKVLADNERLRGEPEFFLTHGALESGSLGGGSVVSNQWDQTLRELLYSELEPAQVTRDVVNEVGMALYFDSGRTGIFEHVGVYRVNYQECYLVTEQGKTYHISKEFAELVRIYYKDGKLPEDAGSVFSREMREEAEAE